MSESASPRWKSSHRGDRLRNRLLREHSLEAVVPLYREAYDMALRGAA